MLECAQTILWSGTSDLGIPIATVVTVLPFLSPSTADSTAKLRTTVQRKKRIDIEYF
jgi:hypothetical protein